jgi:5-formyltetrahydrofolate cyclo-ligase
VTLKVLSLPEYKNANRISVYLSMPTGEVNTSEIVRQAFQDHKKVYVPYIYKLHEASPGMPKSQMDMLALQDLEDYKSLQTDSWGIPSLDKDSIATRKNCFGGIGMTQEGESLATETNEAGLDLILLPGMAFDHACRRLGHGKGFYDFFLHRYKCRGLKMPILSKFSALPRY